MLGTKAGRVFKNTVLFFYLLFFASSAYAGSIAEVKLGRVSLGMKPEQVISELGEPDLRRSEGLNTQGKPVERLDYSVTRRIDMSKENPENDNGQREAVYTCSMMFADGVLVRIDRQR